MAAAAEAIGDRLTAHNLFGCADDPEVWGRTVRVFSLNRPMTMMRPIKETTAEKSAPRAAPHHFKKLYLVRQARRLDQTSSATVLIDVAKTSQSDMVRSQKGIERKKMDAPRPPQHAKPATPTEGGARRSVPCRRVYLSRATHRAGRSSGRFGCEGASSIRGRANLVGPERHSP